MHVTFGWSARICQRHYISPLFASKGRNLRNRLFSERRLGGWELRGRRYTATPLNATSLSNIAGALHQHRAIVLLLLVPNPGVGQYWQHIVCIASLQGEANRSTWGLALSFIAKIVFLHAPSAFIGGHLALLLVSSCPTLHNPTLEVLLVKRAA